MREATFCLVGQKRFLFCWKAWKLTNNNNLTSMQKRNIGDFPVKVTILLNWDKNCFAWDLIVFGVFTIRFHGASWQTWYNYKPASGWWDRARNVSQQKQLLLEIANPTTEFIQTPQISLEWPLETTGTQSFSEKHKRKQK